MNFLESIKSGLSKYADFTGRATRPEFWWFILFVALGNALLSAFNVSSTDGTLYLGTTLASVWSVATLLPTLAVTARRLHDTGRTTSQLWWLLLPIAGLIVIAVYCAEPTKASADVSSQPDASAT